jgi:16S rRNA processing protein RimM
MGYLGGDILVVGHISGAYGVRGSVRIYSHTQPKENILHYSPWYLKRDNQWRLYDCVEASVRGRGIVVEFDDCPDRQYAQRLIGTPIAIRRDQLPRTRDAEYYWVDLIGTRVVNTRGTELGEVTKILETGASDVLVVHGDKPRLIPFVKDVYIRDVDLTGGWIEVDWDPNY